jgi:hypothetical protein
MLAAVSSNVRPKICSNFAHYISQSSSKNQLYRVRTLHRDIPDKPDTVNLGLPTPTFYINSVILPKKNRENEKPFSERIKEKLRPEYRRK